MTERFEPTRSTDRSDPATATTDLDPRATHLVGAYSPRWLSGPSHYEGLVATIAPDEVEPDLGDLEDPGTAAAGTPA